ncbi:MAG: MATE family efflux transporter [Candidatus Zixiibacteriota bacterium]|nr:MAG: MATE family efflux transporter [candidate division Zixibacteria bacterium]
MEKNKVTDHTEGSIIKSILKMGVPSMIGFSTGNIYDLIDMYWVSKLGPEPVAAITFFASFLWVTHSANMIVGVGSVAIISRRYGEKDLSKTELSIKETLLLKWIVAIVFGILGYLFTPVALNLLGAKQQVLDLGITYGRIIFIGLGFNFATYSVFTALRGVANPNKAMVLMISLNLINIILDPFMIFGWWIFPEMGVAGAAWASVISYVFAFSAGLVLFFAGAANVKLHFRSKEHIRLSTMWQILKIGFPSAIGSLSFSLARIVVMPMIAVFGVGVVAAYGVGIRISAFGIMVLVGIGLGLSALIGHNLGANKKERAKKTAYQSIALGVGIMTVMGMIVFFGAGFIMGKFFDDPSIIQIGVTLLRVLAIGFPFLGFHLMIENVYTGVGENRPAMTFNIVHSWLLEVPAIYVSTQVLGLSEIAVWWSISGATAISAIAYYSYFRNGKWLHVKV